MFCKADKDKNKATGKMVDDADKQFAIANRDYQAAQERLNKLLAGANADALRAAQANVGAASADYAAQQAQVNLLLAGARPEDIAVAEANLAQAQAGLESARACVNRRNCRAVRWHRGGCAHSRRTIRECRYADRVGLRSEGAAH